MQIITFMTREELDNVRPLERPGSRLLYQAGATLVFAGRDDAPPPDLGQAYTWREIAQAMQAAGWLNLTALYLAVLAQEAQKTTWFGVSPDAGQSECVCSLCGEPITAVEIPIRIFRAIDDQEARFHLPCFQQYLKRPPEPEGISYGPGPRD